MRRDAETSVAFLEPKRREGDLRGLRRIREAHNISLSSRFASLLIISVIRFFAR